MNHAAINSDTKAEVYYDVRLAAVPIAEPNSLALVLFSLGILLIVRRYVFAHFGK